MDGSYHFWHSVFNQTATKLAPKNKQLESVKHDCKGPFTPSVSGSGSVTMGCIEFQLCHSDQAAAAAALLAASLANGSMTELKR